MLLGTEGKKAEIVAQSCCRETNSKSEERYKMGETGWHGMAWHVMRRDGMG